MIFESVLEWLVCVFIALPPTGHPLEQCFPPFPHKNWANNANRIAVAPLNAGCIFTEPVVSTAYKLMFVHCSRLPPVSGSDNYWMHFLAWRPTVDTMTATSRPRLCFWCHHTVLGLGVDQHTEKTTCSLQMGEDVNHMYGSAKMADFMPRPHITA